ncbi:diguanylate cyclase [Trinickia terrae]|uniref:diguanylate cyclase n=2 Tax=Trinickia terrae TaxID=2571161 RepID=A0A4U1HJL0_9BURK|nr:diguanylate cyclase [Trinickia terrae]
MGSRFRVGISVALAPILVLSCWLLAHQWLAYRAASEAMRSFAAFREALLAMEKVSAERGPTNGVLGENVPIPPQRAALLANYRHTSDQQIARLLDKLALDRSPACAENTDMIVKLQSDLASARKNIDHLTTLPIIERGDVQKAVNRMIALIPEFLPVVVTEMSVVTKGDPDVFDTLLIAKLSADLREQAGQLGSRFTSALATHRQLTGEEQLGIDRSQGRIDQLRALIDLRMLDHPAVTAEALAAVTWRYFGEGERYVAEVQTLASRPIGADVTTGQFAEHYVPTMRSITQLRDVLLAEADGKLQRHYRTTQLQLAAAVTAVLLLLTTLVWMTVTFRRDVINPFVRATRAIHAIAAGDLTTEIPSTSRRAEIRQMFDAIGVLRKYSVERAQLEAERGQLIQELATMADTDSLTRLLNRRAFESRALALLQRTDIQASQIALIMFDIDHFKRLNDTHGHAAGDAALRIIGELCRANWRQSDIVARIGGEEFAVLVNVAAAPLAVALAERMRLRIAEAVVLADGGARCRMTASFGIAIVSPADAAGGVTELLKRADHMLYKAKLAGRDCLMADLGPVDANPPAAPVTE